jgi:antibiotic biosynthesis monooxygenase (ABM) superfamily enzyme
MRGTFNRPVVAGPSGFLQRNILPEKSTRYGQFFALLLAVFPVVFILVKSQANLGIFQVKSQLLVDKKWPNQIPRKHRTIERITSKF